MTPQSTAAGTNGYAASAEETEEEGLGPLRSLEEMRWYREMYKKMQCLNLNGGMLFIYFLPPGISKKFKIDWQLKTLKSI